MLSVLERTWCVWDREWCRRRTLTSSSPARPPSTRSVGQLPCEVKHPVRSFSLTFMLGGLDCCVLMMSNLICNQCTLSLDLSGNVSAFLGFADKCLHIFLV